MSEFDPMSADSPSPEGSSDQTGEPKGEEPKPKKKRGKPRKGSGSYVVAEGKAVTTKRGMRRAGQPVTEKELAGGRDALETLIDKGTLVES